MTFKSISQLYGYNTPKDLAAALDELNNIKREMKSCIKITNRIFKSLDLI